MSKGTIKLKLTAIILSVLLMNIGLLSCKPQKKEAFNGKKKEIEHQVDQFLQPLIDNDLFSGNVLIAKNDSIILLKSYGYANVAHKVKNTVHTKFRIASLSKPITKIAIIQLAEKGLVNFDDPLSKYLPSFPRSDEILIRHLLEESSGIPHLNDFPDYDQFAKEHYASTEEVIDLFKEKPLDFKPGTQTGYSNSAYVLLVHIIEQVTDLSYDNYLKENIFIPAEALSSGHDDGLSVIENLACGYMMKLKGKGLQYPLYYDPSIKIGGGSLYTTIEDLYQIDQAYKKGRLTKSTSSVYNQGINGKSPGYTSLIWEYEGIFVGVLSNNYNAPISIIGQGLLNDIMRSKTEVNFDVLNQIKPIDNNKDYKEYVGRYEIDGDIQSIEWINGQLIQYENGDKLRGCRLLSIGKDHFYDTCYFEELKFSRNSNGIITAMVWEEEVAKKLD